MSKQMIGKESLTNYNLYPIELNVFDGNYVESQLRRIKRTYEAIQSEIQTKQNKRVTHLNKISEVKDNPNSEYNRLVKKPDKGRLEMQKLSSFIMDMERKHNDIYLINTDIRKTKRTMEIKYPKKTMETVYATLAEIDNIEGGNK